MRLLIIFGVLTSVTFITTAIIRSVIGNLIDSKKEIHNTNLRLNNEIKERNKAEEQIQASEKKFREIIEDVSGISIQGYDEQRKVIFWNQASEKLYGYTEQEALGKKIDDLIVPSGMREQIQGLIQKWIEYGEKIPAKEVELIDKNGNIVPVFSSHVMHETPQGKERFCIDIDLTELKLAQEEKIKAQQIAGEHEKLALVGQIAGKMAHDFNNILGIIMGNTELSLLDCKDAETRKTLELIFEQTLRGKNLTRNLVAFAKDQEPRREFFRIYDKIDLVLSLLKIDLKEIELIKEDKPGVPDLLADPGMIEHALVNLVQNSIHALSMVDQPRIIIRTYCLRNNICLEIEDNGCGIPKEHLEKIYEPSFTLKGSCDVTGSYKTGIKGTGYGMSNIKKYIKQHKGSIFVESVFGSGTKFTINLPVIKKELTNEEKTQIQKKITHFEKYILLVEDETAISDIQYRILTQEPCNHKVDIAQNGQIAMDLFKRNEYDVVSLDYVLPGKINGMDVYHHIRKADKTLPILFVSGNINFLESIKELKQKDPYIDHQSKPCQNKNYVYSINRLLKRKLTIS
ncbi:MAG: PAS domain S-box protein [Desulfobacula sp.]|uniref:ATP-binding response regulator n=1 Tax=Desulfobacula sp. TaxID=2593537 RepID=UPI0025C28BD4|nr:ATP-binding protein [Desulfobacula sp.]MCD4721206.1 PAS domain S-box protein [Desulfobacula sp.]